MNQTRRVFNQNTLNELDHSIKTSNEMKFEEYDKLISESIIQNMFHTNQEAFQSHNYQLCKYLLLIQFSLLQKLNIKINSKNISRTY